MLGVRNCGGLLLAALLLGGAAGCQKKVPVGQVEGKVTYKGEPFSEGLVAFFDASQGNEGAGEIQPDGSFTIRNREGGLRVGTYRVAVRQILLPPENPEGSPAPRPGAPVPPRKYTLYETSGITVQVVEGKNPPVVIDMVDN